MAKDNISCTKNLKMLWWLRNIAIIGQLAVIMVVDRFMDIHLPLSYLGLIIGGMALVNIVTFFIIRSERNIGEIEFFLQQLLDITGLFALLYFTGGSHNPFASLFILQVIIAAITLRPLFTWATAILTIGLYTILMFYYIDMPYLHSHHLGDFFNLHVQGMWVSFILLAILVAWFAVRMAATIRKQDKLISDTIQLAAMGTVATAAAHELGTPLATMAIIAGEMEDKTAGKALAEQISRCKNAIGKIISSTASVTEIGRNITLKSFIEDICSSFKANNPDVVFSKEINIPEVINITADAGLSYALVSILDNSAFASPQYINLSARIENNSLLISISDKGKGFPVNILQGANEVGYTTKPAGFGMGLFLARTAINRLNGEMLLSNKSQGAEVKIVVPLKDLKS